MEFQLGTPTNEMTNWSSSKVCKDHFNFEISVITHTAAPVYQYPTNGALPVENVLRSYATDRAISP